MKNVYEKIAEVLSDQSFYADNKDVKTPEELLAAVKQYVPEASNEEIDEILTQVSVQLNKENGELTEDDLDDVAGGVFTVAITVAGIVTAVKYAAAIGAAAGTLYWYYKHRKCL